MLISWLQVHNQCLYKLPLLFPGCQKEILMMNLQLKISNNFPRWSEVSQKNAYYETTACLINNALPVQLGNRNPSFWACLYQNLSRIYQTLHCIAAQLNVVTVVELKLFKLYYRSLVLYLYWNVSSALCIYSGKHGTPFMAHKCHLEFVQTYISL